MGDCDSYKKHISDYLEGNLDKTTREEFEQRLEHSDELNMLTSRVGEVSALLGKLPAHQCSDDFSVKLRKKIHSADSTAKIPTTPLKKYSFAFSFVVAAVLIVFTFKTLDDNPGNVNIVPESSSFQNSNPTPSIKSPSQPVSNSPVSNQQVDIKTIDETKAISDSIENSKKPENEQNFKYVDDKQK